MATTNSPSLMDDAEFASELEKLELTPSATESAASGHSGWDDLDAGLVTDVVSDDADSAEWTPRRATLNNEFVSDRRAATPAPAASIGRSILLVAGVLLLMGVGAGAAALVYHERLTLILH